jgi:endonuclease-3
VLTSLQALRLIRDQVKNFKTPSVTEISRKNDPYLVLVSCILSLRTKDSTTIAASRRLFAAADSAGRMLRLSVGRLERLIYPVGFYHTKARVILAASKKILRDFGGKVPDNLRQLLEIKGVGRKTANLVLGLGHNIPAICVDTHVHRISNRLGWARSKSPQQTEEVLMRVFPKRLWIELNTGLVAFGQNICLPVSPFCSRCPVYKYCPRIGVKKYR